MTDTENNPDDLYELALRCVKNSRFDLAIPILQDLAGKMHALSLYQLGHLYKRHDLHTLLPSAWPSSTIDDQESQAKAYLRAAAGLGVPDAVYELGAFLLRTESDPNEASLWLKKAADNGHVKASFKLAGIYLRSRKLNAAEFYFRRASELGDKKATFELAMLYFSNRLTPPGFQPKFFSALNAGQQMRIENYKRAFPVLVEAANRGYDEAQYMLGLLLSEGLTEFHAEICPRDEAAAERLIREAARKGLGRAIRFLEDPSSDHPRRGLG